MSIIFGLISALFASLGASHRKKAISISTLPKSLYILLWPLSGFFIIGTLILISGVDTSIFNNYNILGLILICIIFDIIANFLEMSVVKKTKLSELLPYTNLDKLFIITIGFFLFYGTDKSTSITTLIITILTIVLITIFSIDFKNFKLPKTIISYSVVLFLRGISVIIVGFIFLQYNTLDYLSVNLILSFLGYSLVGLILKDSFKSLIRQEKQFYISRGISLIFGWLGFAIGLYIIQSSGVLIATLISFVGMIFSIISMKLILKDNPTKKQILLAGIVTILIGIGYYFK